METISCPTCGAPMPLAPAGTTQRCAFCQREMRVGSTPERAEAIATRSWRGGAWPFAVLGVLVLAAAAALTLGAHLAFTAKTTPFGPGTDAPDGADGPGSTPLPLAPTATMPAPDASATPPNPALAEGAATITWTATMLSSSGAAPAHGAPCTLVLEAEAESGSVDERRLTLQCGGEVLYDSDDPLSGISESSFDLSESAVAGETNAFVYRANIQDIGTRAPPRAQISADTSARIVDAFRDVGSMYRVHLMVERDSAVRHGKPLLAENVPAFPEVVTRTAQVTKESGAVPFPAKTCALRISPAKASGSTCRVRLECGGKTVYGAGDSGFDACTIRDGEPRGFSDPVPSPSDGDPVFSVDLDAATATLADTSKSGATYSVTFTLE